MGVLGVCSSHHFLSLQMKTDIGQAKLVGVCMVSDVLDCVRIISATGANVNANGKSVVYTIEIGSAPYFR